MTHTTLPEGADLSHLRDEAKALLRDLHSGTPEATALQRAYDPSLTPSQAKLADAQRLVARKYGFPSWPKLKAEVETPKLIAAFQRHVRQGEAQALDRLLKRHRVVKARIDDPIFDFERPAIAQGVEHRAVVDVLLRHGADPNRRSTWWAGGFGTLDYASKEAAEYLVSRGAKWDVWSAAAHGRIEILRELLDANPESVNAPGGDGMRPLHFATTVEVATFLLDRGADPNMRDVDHEGTPAQHQIRRPEVARLILALGGDWDIFLAAALNDVSALHEILRQDPNAAHARVGEAPFRTEKSNGGHIYLYTLGHGKSPFQVAAEFDSTEAASALEPVTPKGTRLVVACIRHDAEAVERLVAESVTLSPDEARALPDAAGRGDLAAVELMLKAGFNPLTKGMDTGTALHTAAWFGRAAVVERLLGKIPLDLRDDVHGSTPLGWACHGAQWSRQKEGDYVRVVELLIGAGADVREPANKEGTSMLRQAGEREDVKAVLRAHGAR